MVLEKLLSDNSAQTRATDRTFFRRLSAVGSFFGFAEAESLGEQWALDTAYILFESIVQSEYGRLIDFSSPLVVTLDVTNKCPFRCHTCYSNSIPQPNQKREASISLIDRLANTKVPVFILTGGEPLTHPDIEGIVAALVRAERKVIIATALLNERAYRLAALFPRRVTFLVAIWGNGICHDSIRGKGSYSSIVEGIRRLSEHTKKISLNFVIPDSTERAFDGLEHVLIEAPTIRRIFVTRAIGVGRQEVPHAAFDYTHIPRLHGAFRAMETKIGRKLIWSLPSPSEFRPRSPAQVFLSLFGILMPKGCGAGNWVLHVNADGAVSPCFAHGLPWTTLNGGTVELDSAWREVRKGVRHDVVCQAEASSMTLARVSREHGNHIVSIKLNAEG